MMSWSHVYIWVSGILQVVRVDMGICTLKDTAPTQQPWAPSCSTTESVVELASSSNATGASGACLPIKPSPSLPPTSVHPTSRNPAITEDGAMSLDLTSTWPCLLSCRWRSMSAALCLSTTEGRSIVCFFGHPSIRLLWSQNIFPSICSSYLCSESSALKVKHGPDYAWKLSNYDSSQSDICLLNFYLF